MKGEGSGLKVSGFRVGAVKKDSKQALSMECKLSLMKVFLVPGAAVYEVS